MTDKTSEGFVHREEVSAALAQESFQRKVVTTRQANDILNDAIAFFQARGYRAGFTGRPNQVYVLGKREGPFPRVTAEILVQPGVGKRGTTLVTVSGFGPLLRQHLQDYVNHLRAQRRTPPTIPAPPNTLNED